MKNLIACTAITLITTTGVGTAQATVLTFDELTPTDLYSDGIPITSGYGGLDWDSFSYLTSQVYDIPESGYQNGIVSGENVAYNTSADIALVRGSLFNFDNVYLTSAWHKDLSITVEGLNAGDLLYATTVVVDTTAPKLFKFNYLGIDELRFTAFGGVDSVSGGSGTNFVMDNFTFTPVPEPTSTLGLLAFGIFSIMALKRQK